MQLFFSEILDDDIFTFNNTESNHIIRVLRHKRGDIIDIINGNGSRYEAEIISDNPRECKALIKRIEESYNVHPYYLHIAIAPTKNTDRMEWFLEKSIELGINEISFIKCQNSERRHIRTDRLKKIMISAMKQSHKGQSTKINETISFEQFIRTPLHTQKYIATCNTVSSKKGFGELYEKGKDLTFLIGPEGDFSDAEVKLALSSGYRIVDLGKSRLRTETAGITACCWVYFQNQ